MPSVITLNTSLLVAYFAMLILANVTLGPEQAGYLYAAWSLAGFVFFIPLSLAVALFASGARSTATFRMEFRKTLQYSMVVCAAAILVMAVLGNLVLKISVRTTPRMPTPGTYHPVRRWAGGWS